MIKIRQVVYPTSGNSGDGSLPGEHADHPHPHVVQTSHATTAAAAAYRLAAAQAAAASIDAAASE